MNAREATEKFRQADKLCRLGVHQQALLILEELDAAYPGTKNIMYARAVCLAHLERNDEARILCDRILAKQDAPRVAALRAKLGPPPETSRLSSIFRRKQEHVEESDELPPLGDL